jgi:hydrogenase maturation factor
VNLLTGVLEEIYVHDGTTMGRVSIKGATIRVPLMFLPDAVVGDTVLIESGVAISRVQTQNTEEK